MFIIGTTVHWDNMNSAPFSTEPSDGPRVSLEVNIADQRKRTPIHLAAAGGHMQVADPVEVSSICSIPMGTRVGYYGSILL